MNVPRAWSLVTVKLPGWPTVKVVVATEVMASTLTKSVWVASGPAVLWAVTTEEVVPLEPTGAVPEMVAVPFPLFLNVSQVGRLPSVASDGFGDPVVVTVKATLPPTAT